MAAWKFFLAWLIFSAVLCITAWPRERDRCRTARSCHGCFATDPNCAWCKQEGDSNDRCQELSALQQTCDADQIMTPTNASTMDFETESNSPRCYFGGTYECGVCNCTGMRFGRRCECGRFQEMDFRDNCQPSSSSVVCSGRGQCTCGVCSCFPRNNKGERHYGDHCECDNFSCNYHNGKLCNGKGACECGQCVCRDGWKGESCECGDANDSCTILQTM